MLLVLMWLIGIVFFQLHSVADERNKQRVVDVCRKTISTMDKDSARVLKFLLLHLHRVSAEPANKMGCRNLSTVFSPNLVHCISETRRPESMISEMELNNIVVEILIENARDIAAK